MARIGSYQSCIISAEVGGHGPSIILGYMEGCPDIKIPLSQRGTKVEFMSRYDSCLSCQSINLLIARAAL